MFPNISLVYACQIIDRPDMRNRTIEIMAGVHTGAIVAGVVGNRMPRYDNLRSESVFCHAPITLKTYSPCWLQ